QAHPQDALPVGRRTHSKALDSPIERLTREPERAGGARDVSAALAQCRLDHLATRVIERAAGRLHAARASGGKIEMRHADHMVLSQKLRALDAVAQLPHVSRPIVMHERDTGLLTELRAVAEEALRQ